MSKSATLPLIFDLISRATSIAVVSEFLKARGLTSSAGSWADMFTQRIEPALASSQLSMKDLIDLLRSVEEYGRQHIFVFRAPDKGAAEALIDKVRIGQILKTLDLMDLLAEPRQFDMPAKPAFVDIRWAGNPVGSELIIKEVLTRETLEFRGITKNGTTIQRNYETIKERVVNVIRLTSKGDLEIRLASRRGSSRYSDDLKDIAVRLQPFLTLHDFKIVSFAKAKAKLWSDRSALAQKLGFPI